MRLGSLPALGVLKGLGDVATMSPSSVSGFPALKALRPGQAQAPTQLGAIPLSLALGSVAQNRPWLAGSLGSEPLFGTSFGPDTHNTQGQPPGYRAFSNAAPSSLLLRFRVFIGSPETSRAYSQGFC